MLQGRIPGRHIIFPAQSYPTCMHRSLHTHSSWSPLYEPSILVRTCRPQVSTRTIPPPHRICNTFAASMRLFHLVAAARNRVKQEKTPLRYRVERRYDQVSSHIQRSPPGSASLTILRKDVREVVSDAAEEVGCGADVECAGFDARGVARHLSRLSESLRTINGRCVCTTAAAKRGRPLIRERRVRDKL